MQGRYRGFDDGRGYTPNPNPNSSFRKFNNRTSTAYNRSSNFNRRPCLPPPPPSKHEILMRAGKLAAEYLVSQGLLDPGKLPHNRGKSGKLKDFEGLKYGKESDDSWNEDYYGPSEYYREKESGFDQLPGRSGNTMESRSEIQDLAEDGGSKTSSLSLKKDVLDEMVGDDPIADSGVSKEVQSDADYDSKKETTTEDNNNNTDGDDVMEAIALENVNIEMKEEKKETDGEEKSINKRKREVELKEEEREIDGEEESTNKRERENDELPVRNIRLKERSQDEEIEAPLEIMEEKIEDEIDGKIEEGEEDAKIEEEEDGKIEEEEDDDKIEGEEDGKIEEEEDGKIEEEEEDGKIEEEKQVSSEPLEACDLNLVHGNEVTENDKENEIPVNIELDTINNNGNESGEFDKISNDVDDKEVQVGDIEVDVAVDGSAIDPSNPEDADAIREEPIYPNLDSFLNQHEHADLNCIHDGYSLDFPNFLGSDITGCSSIPAHLNNLGSEMEGLQNDDDSIYVSLAEIPIGFMEVWDTPGQDFGKFF